MAYLGICPASVPDVYTASGSSSNINGEHPDLNIHGQINSVFFTKNMDNPPSTSNTSQVRPSHFIPDRKTPPPASNFNVITHLLYQNKPTVKIF